MLRDRKPSPSAPSHRSRPSTFLVTEFSFPMPATLRQHARSQISNVQLKPACRRQAHGDATYTVWWFCGDHPSPAKAHGVVEEEEDHGGCERVRELGEDRANEVADTASESYDAAEWNNVDRSIFCTRSPWTPRLGIRLGGLDPDPLLHSSPSRGLFGVWFRRAEDPEVE